MCPLASAQPQNGESDRRDERHFVSAVKHTLCPHSPAARARKRPIGSYGPNWPGCANAHRPRGEGVENETKLSHFWRVIAKEEVFRRGASAPGLLKECCPSECRKPKMLFKNLQKICGGQSNNRRNVRRAVHLTFANKE